MIRAVYNNPHSTSLPFARRVVFSRDGGRALSGQLDCLIAVRARTTTRRVLNELNGLSFPDNVVIARRGCGVSFARATFFAAKFPRRDSARARARVHTHASARQSLQMLFQLAILPASLQDRAFGLL